MTNPKAAKAASADLSPQQQATLQRARERQSRRTAPLDYNMLPETTGDAVKLETPFRDGDHDAVLREAFGTASGAFASEQLSKIAGFLRSRTSQAPTQGPLNAGIAAVAGVAPQNEVEAMLAVQMVGTHEMATEMLMRAKATNDPDLLDRYSNLATKLLRTYTAQAEALAKLQRGGAQNVRVEHVHVYEGGQAIVGNVEHSRGGGQDGSGQQAYAPNDPRALATAPVASLLCQDANRDRLPVAGRQGQGALPNARRRQG